MTTPTARAFFAAGALLLAACGSSSPPPEADAVDAGLGSEADEHRYSLGAAEVWAAAETAMGCADLQIERRRRDERGGEIVARRADGHRVKVTVLALEEKDTSVAVVVDPENRELTWMIQGTIGQKLNLAQARANLFGEHSVDGSYEIELDRCVAAVERTCRALNLEVRHKQIQGSRVRIEARDADDRPLRFTMRLSDGRSDETEVLLTTEPASSGGELQFLEHVRREFERRLFPVAE